MELRILAGLLAYPEEDALERLREWMPALPWLGEAVAELETLPLDRWQGEHTHLFLNGFPKTIAPPFMSYWNEGRMVGNNLGALHRVYRDAGLEPVDGLPGDYLGTMLEFLALLLDNPQTPGSPGSMDAQTFYKQFLHPWIQRFVQALREGSELFLYRKLAERLELLLTQIGPTEKP
ncbi:MAG: molecular chaperone TorD family protein [Magnetococcales bacterium]|nr:molecular chaperone TorD family protein [Magnetococcales bacterium]